LQQQPTTKDLAEAIAEGNNLDAVNIAQKLLENGIGLETVVDAGLTKALESLDYKCGTDQFSLLEILLAGRAMMDVMEQVIGKHYQGANLISNKQQQTVVLGTIKGDIHDLGKNIVGLMLKVSGYKVVDLGKDVAPSQFIEAAVQEQAQYIGVSSLITTTVANVKEVKKLALEQGLTNIKVLAGGAALRQASPEQINVDFVAKNVFDLLRYLKSRSEGK
jgi:methylmalonyl-CoA mutase cobalamin-binding domain/chain